MIPAGLLRRALGIFLLLHYAEAFSKAFAASKSVSFLRMSRLVRPSNADETESSIPASLEEKMKSWEATEEEKAAATLGGLTPGKMDGTDTTQHKILAPALLDPFTNLESNMC